MSTDKLQIKDVEGDRPADDFAPGAVDGKIVMLTPDEAAKLIGDRDAEEEAFNAQLFGDDVEDLDDVSDLDDDGGVE